MPKPTPGIRERHSRACGSHQRRACNCTPSLEVFVYSKRDGRKIRKTFNGPGAARAAKQWRADSTSALHKGTMRAPASTTLREAGDELVAGMRDGSILARTREPFKPSVTRGYTADLKRYVYPDLGASRLADITRFDLQALVDRMVADGHSGSKVRNAIMPLRVLFRRAVRRGLVMVNPCTDLELPAPSAARERADTPTAFEETIAVLGADDQALWRTAFYSGLRRGELRGLRWSDVDLEVSTISVQRSWDDEAGQITPKSKAGVRVVPIPTRLRVALREHQVRTGRRDEGFVFGSSASSVFTPSNVRRRAAVAWTNANKERAEKELEPLVPIGLHECRHSWVSWLHDAAVPFERVSDYAGHATAGSAITERYRHALPGQHAEDVKTMDAYLTRVETGAQAGAQAAGTA